MSKVKEIFLEEQQRAARRTNPDFMHHINMIKNAPSPTDFKVASYNGISAFIDEIGASAYQKAILLGMIDSYGDSVRLETMDGLDTNPVFPQSEHALMLSTNPEAMVS